jgi:hypothetical protein
LEGILRKVSCGLVFRLEHEAKATERERIPAIT